MPQCFYVSLEFQENTPRDCAVLVERVDNICRQVPLDESSDHEEEEDIFRCMLTKR